jgi:ABC-type phosphate/phosphonate transport system substrate-binding protein
MIELVSNYRILATKLEEGKLDVGVFHGFEYAWVKDNPALIPIVVALPNCEKVQACLVVRANSKAKEPKDLKGACVAVPKKRKAHCQLFLERIQANVPQGDCCEAKLEGLTPKEVLDAVVTEQCEAALVELSSMLAYQNDTPGLGRQLKILVASEVFPPGVVVYRKGALSPNEVEVFRKGLLNYSRTPAGKTLALFWQLKGFEDVSEAYKKKLEECLKAYPRQPAWCP